LENIGALFAVEDLEQLTNTGMVVRRAPAPPRTLRSCPATHAGLEPAIGTIRRGRPTLSASAIGL
jgi:hypothetical protein